MSSDFSKRTWKEELRATKLGSWDFYLHGYFWKWGRHRPKMASFIADMLNPKDLGVPYLQTNYDKLTQVFEANKKEHTWWSLLGCGGKAWNSTNNKQPTSKHIEIRPTKKGQPIQVGSVWSKLTHVIPCQYLISYRPTIDVARCGRECQLMRVETARTDTSSSTGILEWVAIQYDPIMLCSIHRVQETIFSSCGRFSSARSACKPATPPPMIAMLWGCRGKAAMAARRFGKKWCSEDNTEDMCRQPVNCLQHWYGYDKDMINNSWDVMNVGIGDIINHHSVCSQRYKGKYTQVCSWLAGSRADDCRVCSCCFLRTDGQTWDQDFDSQLRRIGSNRSKRPASAMEKRPIKCQVLQGATTGIDACESTPTGQKDRPITPSTLQ